MASLKHAQTAFKILGPQDWKAWSQSGLFKGATVDLADGFIHLSTAEQSRETYGKYFAGQKDLVVVEVDLQVLGDSVAWEPSRNQDLFPHVYRPIPLSAILRVHEAVDEAFFNAIRAERT